jgi:hypothetical protein
MTDGPSIAGPYPIHLTTTEDSTWNDLTDDGNFVADEISSRVSASKDSTFSWQRGFIQQMKKEITHRTFFLVVAMSLLSTFSIFLFLPLGLSFFQFNLSMATLTVCFLMLAVFGISPYAYSEGFFLPVSDIRIHISSMFYTT